MLAAAAQLRNLIKITEVHKASSFESSGTFWGGASVSSNQRRHLAWLTDASHRFQTARVANFPTLPTFYRCSTMGRESSVPSVTVMTVTVRCYENRSDVQENFSPLMVWRTSFWNGFDVVVKVDMMILFVEHLK